MLFGMFLMLVFVSAAAGALFWFLWLRMGEHLKENPDAVAAVVNHILVPIMGRKKPPDEPAPDGPPRKIEKGGIA